MQRRRLTQKRQTALLHKKAAVFLQVEAVLAIEWALVKVMETAKATEWDLAMGLVKVRVKDLE